MNRWLCIAAWAFLVGGWSAGEVRAEARRPNIILIFSDDYGIPGVGCYGGQYPTPNLDALAAGGVRFTHCFAMPLCAPSRAMTLSGRYPFRNGVLHNNLGSAYAPENSPSIAKTLKQAGYATAVAGKWRQLQHFDTPEQRAAWGFDEALVWGLGKGERYWQPDYLLNGKPIGDVGEKYGPDILHEFVVDFMTRHREEPFFVYYPTPLIHGPILRTPDSKSTDKKSGDFYADNVAYLDKLVGKLVAEVDRLGLRDNTLIVFTGDNGSTGNQTHTIDGKPIIGKKGNLLEGGSRVPLIANWPGKAPAGKVVDDLVEFSDFYATLAEAAGASLPSNVKLDSHSFAPQIRGEKGTPRDWVFVQLGNEWYARERGWKLTGDGKLFDMSAAPFDEKASAPSASTEAEAAQKRLAAVLADLNPAGGAVAPDRDKQKDKAKKKARKTRKEAQEAASAQDSPAAKQPAPAK